jgi:hypothetical protein
MGGMVECPLLDQPGPCRYPGFPSTALMGAPGALVAGAGRFAVGRGDGLQALAGLLQRRSPVSWVNREARQDQIPTSHYQGPISSLFLIT